MMFFSNPPAHELLEKNPDISLPLIYWETDTHLLPIAARCKRNVLFTEQNWIEIKHFPLSASQTFFSLRIRANPYASGVCQSTSTFYLGKSKRLLGWKLRSSRVEMMEWAENFQLSRNRRASLTFRSLGGGSHGSMGWWTDSCWNRHTHMQEPFVRQRLPTPDFLYLGGQRVVWGWNCLSSHRT